MSIAACAFTMDIRFACVSRMSKPILADFSRYGSIESSMFSPAIDMVITAAIIAHKKDANNSLESF